MLKNMFDPRLYGHIKAERHAKASLKPFFNSGQLVANFHNLHVNDGHCASYVRNLLYTNMCAQLVLNSDFTCTEDIPLN
jgi:hypothetical protein